MPNAGLLAQLGTGGAEAEPGGAGEQLGAPATTTHLPVSCPTRAPQQAPASIAKPTTEVSDDTCIGYKGISPRQALSNGYLFGGWRFWGSFSVGAKLGA